MEQAKTKSSPVSKTGEDLVFKAKLLSIPPSGLA